MIASNINSYEETIVTPTKTVTECQGTGHVEQRSSSSHTAHAIEPPNIENSSPWVLVGRKHKTPKTSREMSPAQQDGSETRNELRLLQEVSMQKLNRTFESTRKRGKEKQNTVSLRDLDLARAPVLASKPIASIRNWAEDSPITNDIGSEYGRSPAKIVQISNLTEPKFEIQVDTPAAETVTKRNSRWVSNKDTKPAVQDHNSNAFGSDCPSDATRESNIIHESYGKLLNRKLDWDTVNTSLKDWEGNVLPPPPDWHDRPRYNNNNSEFKKSFSTWLSSGHYATKQESAVTSNNQATRKAQFSNGLAFGIVPHEKLTDTAHPDGISMVPRIFTINTANAMHYGYTFDGDEHPAKYANLVTKDEFEGEAFLDQTDPNNIRFQHETTENLVENWLKHIKNAKQISHQAGVTVREEHDEDQVEPVEYYQPKLNIYLRPATEADLSELTRIYNSHIRDGVVPPEVYPVDESQMQLRIDTAREHHLPFLVAAKKNQKGSKQIPLTDGEEYSRRRKLPVQHEKRLQLTSIEQLAGFCCAQDYTCADYVEHISADIELYTDLNCKQMGVAKCLLDRMLYILDRGYMLTTKCAFHCAPEIRHRYGLGGDRDLAKVYFQIRKFNQPVGHTIQPDKKREHRKLPMHATSEGDYDLWMKKWFEGYGFEQEGLLRKVGAKNGR